MAREKQLGCLGGSVVIVVAGLIFWNDWTVGIRPGREAYRAVRSFEVGVSWPDAVVAAERSLPVGRMFVGKCRLADGQYAYFGRWKSGFMTQLPKRHEPSHRAISGGWESGSSWLSHASAGHSGSPSTATTTSTWPWTKTVG